MNITRTPRLTAKDARMARTTAKLQLVTETLYRLDATELAVVVGGTRPTTASR